MRHSTYLVQSRHGVFYFRARTPLHLRQRHPELPAETKASLGSKNRRFACTVAHLIFRQWVDWIADLDRQDLPIMDLRFSSWITYRHPVYGRVVQTTPDDTPATLAALAAYLQSIEARSPAAAPGTGGDTTPRAETTAPQPTFALPASPIQLPAPIQVPVREPAPESHRDPAAAAPSTAYDPTAGFTAHRGKAAEWLSDVIEKWHRHKVNSGAWKATSTWTNANEPDLRVFRELVADARRIPAPGAAALWDLHIGDLDEARLGRFVECFWQYPAQQGKRAVDNDAKAALAMQAAPQTVFSAKKKLGRILAFLRWAAQLKYLSRDNLVELEMALESGPKVDPKGGYRAFSRDELQRIFGSSKYVDDTFGAAWQYFAPLLALHTGARVREIADLTVADFVTADGSPCIHFRGDTVVAPGPGGATVVHKRVKTPGSERKIPLSRTLLDLGLLDYVNARRAAGEVWLWDGLLWEEKSGRGRYISQWFAAFLASLGVKGDRSTTFHSFRSNLNQALTDLGYPDATIDRILGHAPKSIRGKHYSKDPNGDRNLPIPLVREALDRIDWGVTVNRSGRWIPRKPA